MQIRYASSLSTPNKEEVSLQERNKLTEIILSKVEDDLQSVYTLWSL